MMKRNWLAPAMLGLVAAIVYFVPMADYAFPGESARLIACWKGLASCPANVYPLMAVFAKLLGGGNLIAPVCGTISVVMLFVLVRMLVSARVASQSAATLAALVASVVFMLSPAVRSAATHLEPRLFDFTWAILIAALAIPFLRPAGRSPLPFAVMSGVAVAFGLVDSALFLACAPLYLMLVALVSKRCGKSPYLPSLLFVLSVLLAFFAAAWAFRLDLNAFVPSTLAELASYYRLPGWHFVFIFTTLPFLSVLLTGYDEFEVPLGPVPLLFHAALSFAAILAVATPLSSFALMEPYGRLPVATSAFAAVVAGYLVAYWWHNRQAKPAVTAGSIMLVALVGTVLWNLLAFDGKAGAFADMAARKIVADLDGRRTLVTDGAIDSHLRIAAAEMKKDIRILSPVQVLEEGRRSESGIAVNDLAVFAAPDFLYSVGVEPIPEFLFFGTDAKRVPDWSAWREFDRVLQVPGGWGANWSRPATSPVNRLRLALRRYAGLVANDRGVYLQRHGRDDEAFKMYDLVLREIDGDNVSAALNEIRMAMREYPPAKARRTALEAQVKAADGDKSRRNLLWRLGSSYGYLSDHEAFVRLGYEWAQSGRPGAAAPKVVRMTPEDRDLALAISQNNEIGARMRAVEILQKDPDAPLANYVMGSLALADGRIAEAERLLRKAADGQRPVPLALNDLAEVLRRDGKYAEAESYARKCVECAPTMYVAWETLGSILMDAGGNLDEAESAIRKACALSKGKDGKAADVRMLVSLARVQLKKGDAQHAEVTVRKVQSRINELSKSDRAEFERMLQSRP